MPFVFRLFKIVYYRTCCRQSSIKVTSIKENWTTIKSNEKDIRFFFLQSLMELWQESNWFFVLILFFFYSWSWIRNRFIQAFLNGSMHYTLAEFLAAYSLYLGHASRGFCMWLYLFLHIHAGSGLLTKNLIIAAEDDARLLFFQTIK